MPLIFHTVLLFSRQIRCMKLGASKNMLGTKFYRDNIHKMYWNLSSANYRVDG
jgi:hypothetical protein